MMDVAKRTTSRNYRSTLREEQAARTRSAVIDAAGDCFVAAGYAATTMKDVATRAGVSVETVYGQGSKAALLLATVDRVLVGDDDPVPVIERAPVRAVLDAPSPAAAVRRFRDLVVAGLPVAQPMLHVFERAAGSDAEIAAAYATYAERRLIDLRRIADSLAPGLRPGVSVDEAADVLWMLLSPPTAQLLIQDRGWDAERFGDWFAEALRRLLLR